MAWNIDSLSKHTDRWTEIELSQDIRNRNLLHTRILMSWTYFRNICTRVTKTHWIVLYIVKCYWPVLQMTLLVLQVLLVVLWPLPLVFAMGRMEVLYSWKEIDLNFPTSALRDLYISRGQFIPKNNVILDVDVWNGELWV